MRRNARGKVKAVGKSPKKRTGRPPMEDPRTARIPVAVTPGDKERVVRVAAQLGLHPSTLARYSLMERVAAEEAKQGRRTR